MAGNAFFDGRFFEWYNKIEDERDRKLKMAQDLREFSNQGLSALTFNVPEEKFLQATIAVSNKIASINQDLTKFTRIHEPIENAGGSDETKGAEVLKSAQELTTLQDELRTKVLELKKMMQSEHFYSQIQYASLQRLEKEINNLQKFLHNKHFNEGSEKSSKKTIMDEKWDKKLAENPLDLANHAASAENHLIISTHDWNKHKYEVFSKIYNKETVHEDIKLNRAQVFEAVDMMQHADHYIALWERNLKILKNNPHDADAKKYEKFGPLLEKLKAAKQKNFTGHEVMELKVEKNRTGLEMRIDCKSREGKQAMLDILTEYSNLLEKPEKKAEAGFEAELEHAPELRM